MLSSATRALRNAAIEGDRARRLAVLSDTGFRNIRLRAAERHLSNAAADLRKADVPIAELGPHHADAARGASIVFSQAADDIAQSFAGRGSVAGKSLAQTIGRQSDGLRDAYSAATNRIVNDRVTRFFNPKSHNNVLSMPAWAIPEEVAAAGWRGPVIPEALQTGRNLTAEANAGRIDPVLGRDEEIEQVIEILGRRGKGNPIIVGEAGVGKTALIEGLAQRIVAGDVPQSLQNTAVIDMNLGTAQQGSKFRGDFEKSFGAMLDAAERSNGRIILFMDEFHEVLGAGSHSGASNVGGDMIKKPLARGRIKVIGATTNDEFRTKVQGADPAVARRFDPVYVEPPDGPTTVGILDGLTPVLADHYGVRFAPDVTERTVAWAERYIKDRNFPDKAIDVLDRTASRVSANSMRSDEELVALRAQQKTLNAERKELVGLGPEARDRIAAVQAKLDDLSTQVAAVRTRMMQDLEQNGPMLVTADDIAETVAARTGIPVAHMIDDNSADATNLATYLKQHVVDQDHVVDAIASALSRTQAGFGDPTKPIGKIGMYGPTGVGKTHIARKLANYLFGDETAVVRIDGKTANLSTLIGSGRGIADSGKGGALTEPVRQRPFQVILVDEHEKVSQEINEALLQALDDGFMTDGMGRRVDFSNTVWLFTGNVGAKAVLRAGSGVVAHDEVMGELAQRFAPELLNRMDEILAANPIRSESMRRLTDISVDDGVAFYQRERDITLTMDDGMRDRLSQLGYDPENGARPLKRALDRHWKSPVAEVVLNGRVKAGGTLDATLAPDGTAMVLSVDGEEVGRHALPAARSAGDSPVLRETRRSPVDTARNAAKGFIRTAVTKAFDQG